MANIQKRVGKTGKTSYRVQVRLKGRGTRTKTFSRLTDARTWAREVEADLGRGKHVPTTQQQRKTFDDLADKYLKEVLPRKVRGKDQRHFTQRLNWWRDQLGARYLSDIGPAEIAACRDQLEQTTNRYGKPLSGATVNRYLAALGATYRHAVTELHWLDASPVSNVARRAESKGRTRFLSDDERKRLLAACKDSPHPALYSATLLAVTTGMRKSEILGLTWPQLDLKRRLARLTDTKNSDARTVPLPQVAVDRLEAIGKVRRLDDDRVFPETAGFDHAWKKVVASAQLTDFRFHDCRHTAASYLAMHGASLHELSQILGHRTLAMVQRYAHLTEQHQQAVVDRMADKVFSDV
jgi:integrase